MASQLLFHFFYVCMSVCLCVMCAHMRAGPTKARKACWIPPSWSGQAAVSQPPEEVQGAELQSSRGAVCALSR